ncbi:MAG: RNA polymerase sigma factor [Blastocatellia bacterium]
MTGSQPAREANLEQMIESILPEIRNSVWLACSFYKYRASRDEVDDLCQEITLFLIEDGYRRLRSFDHRSSVKTWLRTVVRHYVLRHLQRRKTEVSLEDIPSSSAIYRISEDDAIWHEQARDVVQAAIARLSERERQLFDLCLRDDLKASDKAKLMQMKVDSVYPRKNALIKKIQKLLGIEMLHFRN